MDQSEDQIQKKFNKYKFLKRTLQFVFPVSVFSFFVWYSSGFSILPQSFNVYFSTCLFSMFTHTLERKYMFLVCNGILAFLAKSSLMTSSPPISTFDIEFQASNLSGKEAPISEEVVVPPGCFGSPDHFPLMGEEEVLEKVKMQEECYEEVSEADEEQEDGTLYTETEGRENGPSIAEEEEDEGKDEEDAQGGTGSGVMGTQDGEVADTTRATNEELANTEELNRKFEEFIRKMKEEIRIEARRQLIAV